MPTNELCCLAWVYHEPCKSNRMKTFLFVVLQQLKLRDESLGAPVVGVAAFLASYLSQIEDKT